MDTINGVIYAHTKFKAFTYTPYKENRYTLVGVAWSYPSPHSRNIWRIYLDQGKYEQAIHFAEVCVCVCVCVFVFVCVCVCVYVCGVCMCVCYIGGIVYEV